MRPKPLMPTLVFAIVNASRVVPAIESSNAWQAGGPGSSEDDPPGPSPARDLTADGV
jgi:hypothetical protein